MLTAPTFAAALVSGLRTHGHRPSGPTGRRWAEEADAARTLALGLVDAGVTSGSVVRVAGDGDPAARVADEVAVLAAGAALAIDDEVGVDGELDGAGLRGAGAGRSRADLLAAGRARDHQRPDAHEDGLAAVAPTDLALAGAGLLVSHAQARWALRSVAAWIGPIVPDGPAMVLASVGGPVAAALVGRWWPAVAGARLALPADGGATGPGPVAAAREARPDVVVADATGWTALADGLRAEASRTRAGTALLRRGRALVAGEASSRTERLGRGLAEHRVGARVRFAAGLDGLVLGVCLGPLPVGTARDLAAVGVPVVATWIDPRVPGPVAAGPLARPRPSECWARPLPGRTLAVGPPAVVHGGDIGPAGVAVGPIEVDARDRIRLPRARATVLR